MVDMICQYAYELLMMFEMQINIPTVYTAEIHCCIVKSTKLSTIFAISL
jgi:hypothetical protein